MSSSGEGGDALAQRQAAGGAQPVEEGAAQGRVVEEAVDVAAADGDGAPAGRDGRTGRDRAVVVRRAVGAAQPQQRRGAAPERRAAHVDLVAVQRRAGRAERRAAPTADAAAPQQLALHAHRALVAGEGRLDVEQAEAVDAPGVGLDVLGVVDAAAEHLVAAADADHGRAGGGLRQHRRRHPALPQPRQVGDRALGAGQHDRRGAVQLAGRRHVAHVHVRLVGQRVEVRVVADERQPHDGDLQRRVRLRPAPPVLDAEGVLLVAAPVGEHRHDAQGRHAGALPQEVDAGVEQASRRRGTC